MPETTANRVYLTARQGLVGLVSAAAAGRVLDKSLADAGVMPSSVRARQMRALLLGPILDELELILPRAGLERTLEVLAESLGDERPAAPLSREPVTPVSVPGSAQVARSRTARIVSGVRTELTRARVNPEAQLQAAVLRLAAIDHVSQVAAVRSSGETVFSRGAGDVQAMARLGRLALSLLLRSGPLRMFYMTTGSSSLLLFPWGSDALLLAGAAELNVGAVVTTFKDLTEGKEES